MEKGRIRHMAIFTLKHEPDAPEAAQFLADGERILSLIPTVEKFEVLYQTSPKSNFDFGFSMEFANQEAYEAYNNHPEHVSFVQQRWEKEVERFQEIDFEAYVK